MAGKKDNAVVAVITGVTKTQANNIVRDIMKSKSKHAPHSRGTAATGLVSNVSNLLQGGFRKCLKG